MTFTIIDGTERFKVTDMQTGGESFFDEKIDAYKYASIIVNILHHRYKIEDRKEHWTSEGGL